MSEPQFFPIPPDMLALASETVSRRVSRLPFERNGVLVTDELIGIAMECLNAEFNKILPLKTPREAARKTGGGLDCCMEERVRIAGKEVVPVIAEVLYSAGIAETTVINDRGSHRSYKGIRLLPAWSWHVASDLIPVYRPERPGTSADAENAAWTGMCAVCRTGILTRVTGKQLFGIPRTDFYMECTHCGAKFIPVSSQFRLVSIAHIRDPLWKKHLDQTYPAETWSAIARGTRQSGSSPVQGPAKKTVGMPLKFPPGGLSHLKDGSLVVPCGEKTLYFKPVKLHFFGGLKENVFARSQKSLQEILQNPAFSHLVSNVNARYSRYLPLKSGLFLAHLKERHDAFYREFLNTYGDEKYCSFRLEGAHEGDKKGVLIVVHNRNMYYAVNCDHLIREMINSVIGRISPEDCFLTGNSTSCRINALLSNNRKDTGMYVYACEREEERMTITETLLRGLSIHE